MTTRHAILIVEDDTAIRHGLVEAIGFAGHTAVEAADGPAALALFDASPVDLVLLDVMLPRGMDGFEVLAALRRRSATVPVIMLTALGAEDDRVQGLSGGADDYIVKPFGVRELLARIDAVLRRSPQRGGTVTALARHGCRVCLDRHEATLADGTVVPLSEREVALLAHLASHRERAIHRDELLRSVWGLDPRGLETRTVDMQVTRLREKLAPTEFVATARGRGYMLAEGVEVEDR